MSQPGHDNVNFATKGEPLMLPAPTDSDPIKSTVTKLDTTSNQTVKLDELGPMVVNSDGTLSRIANWTQLTDMERERTLRVLSARNKLRLANEERKQREADQPAGMAS
ncbi:hypothetical protein B0H34DRAFT_799897 [Crassisporium funariophilum]|nr:hypothetical protein B0H34DRAFT_799897 [Crassisporium funariophilum]